MTSDEELLAACRIGDSEAFVILVRRYQRRVAGTIHGMLGECPEVDDISQEVFIRFYRHLDRYRQECSVATFLTRIAINLSLNELKRRRRKRWLFPFTLDQAQDQAEVRRNPAEQEELHQWLRKALEELPEKYRLVVVLRLIEGHSIKETAEILQIAAGTVMSRLARSQELMRRRLTSVLGERDE